MFYLGPRRCSAPAAVSLPGPCQSKPFPVFAAPGPTKPPVFQCSTTWGADLLDSGHIRGSWRIMSIALLTSGDQIPQNCNVFLCLGSRSLKNCTFGNAKIHQTPLTSKSKENNREQINITIKTCMYKIIQKARCTWAPCQQNDPNRGGLGVAH